MDRFGPDSSFAVPLAGDVSAEVWLKTGANGRLLGFGNASTGASTSLDRNLYLTNSGTLVFGCAPDR